MRSIEVKHFAGFYNYIIQKGLITEGGTFPLGEERKRACMIIDEKVHSLYSNNVAEFFEKYYELTEPVIITAQESSKAIDYYLKVIDSLIQRKIDRKTIIISVGGGITGDLASFAASTFMRGISYIQVPTTLLSMVDSALGGKTGINYLNFKNFIGSFHQPLAVFCDPSFLKTLQYREILSGLGEVIKYGFIEGNYLFDFLNQNISRVLERDETLLEEVIYNSAMCKAKIIMMDERDTGERHKLNLGHTFGHAFEKTLHFSVPHGICVSAGIETSLTLSKVLGIIDDQMFEKLTDLPKKLPFPSEIGNLKFIDVYNAMFADKKVENGKLKFVLVKSPGEIITGVEAEEEQVRVAFEETIKNRFNQ